MCLSVWYTFPEMGNSDLRFVLLFNRDEFLSRKTQLLHKWENSDIIAGRDFDEKRVATNENGTWLGINYKTKRICWLTNALEPGLLIKDTADRIEYGLQPQPGQASASKKSRGLLVKEILEDGDTFMEDYFIDLDMSDYGDAHIMVADDEDGYKVYHKHKTAFSQFPENHAQSMSNSTNNYVFKKQKLAQKKLNSLIDAQEEIDMTTESRTKYDEKFVDKCFDILQNIDKEQNLGGNYIFELDDPIAQQMTMGQCDYHKFNPESEGSDANDEEKFCRAYQQIFQDHRNDSFDKVYGTRSSTVILVYRNKRTGGTEKIKIIERSMELESNCKVEGSDMITRRLPKNDVGFPGGTEVRGGF